MRLRLLFFDEQKTVAEKTIFTKIGDSLRDKTGHRASNDFGRSSLVLWRLRGNNNFQFLLLQYYYPEPRAGT